MTKFPSVKVAGIDVGQFGLDTHIHLSDLGVLGFSPK